MPPTDFDADLVSSPDVGRIYRAQQRVRLGDVGPRGRLRLDALARYLQDVSNDDARDADLPDAMAWVVRRTRIDVEQLPVFGEDLTLATWCSGVGPRWATRRIDVNGARGSRVSAETLWVHVDLERGTPKRLPESFMSLFGEAANGRSVRATLRHAEPVDSPVDTTTWPLRFADIDLMGHVNNAVSWAIVEEVLADRPHLRPTARAEIEYPGPIDPGSSVSVAVYEIDEAALAVRVTADGVLASTAVVRAGQPSAGSRNS